MTKKNYEKPSLEVVMLNPSDLIATSGDMQNVTLSLDIDVLEEYGIAD